MEKEEPFVKKNVSKVVSILRHGAQVFKRPYTMFLGRFSGSVGTDSGEDFGGAGEVENRETC